MESSWLVPSAFTICGMAAAMLSGRASWTLSPASKALALPLQLLGVVSSFLALYLFWSDWGILQGLVMFSAIAFASAAVFRVFAAKMDGFVTLSGLLFFALGVSVYLYAGAESEAEQTLRMERIILSALGGQNDNSSQYANPVTPPNYAYPTAPATEVRITDPLDALRAGMTMERVRSILLNGGWQLARASRSDLEERCGSRQAICRQFIEAQGCAGSGLGECRFEYFHLKKGRLIAVSVGDDPALDNWWLEKESNWSARVERN